MSRKTIYLIRHAQPDFPHGERLCLGRRCDLPLSPAGLEQAALLGQIFLSLPIEAVHSSPLLRARQTASPIAAGLRPLYIGEDLTELDGGEWDGMPFSEIRRRFPGFHRPGAYTPAPPGGESDQEGTARIMAAFARIEQSTERCAAIVAHAGVNCLLLSALLSKPLQDKRQFRHGYGAITVLNRENGKWSGDAIGILPEAWPHP